MPTVTVTTELTDSQAMALAQFVALLQIVGGDKLIIPFC